MGEQGAATPRTHPILRTAPSAKNLGPSILRNIFQLWMPPWIEETQKRAKSARWTNLTSFREIPLLRIPLRYGDAFPRGHGEALHPPGHSTTAHPSLSKTARARLDVNPLPLADPLPIPQGESRGCLYCSAYSLKEAAQVLAFVLVSHW